MNILVTGGLGYLGSHAVVELARQNYKVLIVDNLSNSHKKNLKNLEKIIGQKVIFYEEDIRDKTKLEIIFKKNNISGIMHFAGLKSVKKSNTEKKEYFDVNVRGTENLVSVFNDARQDEKFFIFSSSACVYGNPDYLPYDEKHNLQPQNYYGQTKLEAELLLKNTYLNNKNWKIIILRYFNPLGAHHSYLIGDKSLGKPENLMPNIINSVSSKEERLQIFGFNYDTSDGTPVRDFIHVEDLINGHVLALNYLKKTKKKIYEIFNLGTGKGVTVLELIEAFIKVAKKDISYVIKDRRPGDIDVCFADPRKSNDILKWKSKKSLQDMCKDSINAIRNISGR